MSDMKKDWLHKEKIRIPIANRIETVGLYNGNNHQPSVSSNDSQINAQQEDIPAGDRSSVGSGTQSERLKTTGGVVEGSEGLGETVYSAAPEKSVNKTNSITNRSCKKFRQTLASFTIQGIATFKHGFIF